MSISIIKIRIKSIDHVNNIKYMRSLKVLVVSMIDFCLSSLTFTGLHGDLQYKSR